MPSNSKNRRSIYERAEAIFDFIDAQDGAFPKSKLKKIGLNPNAAEKWLDLIQFIQRKPKIRVLKTNHNTIIEKIEQNFNTIMMKRILDENLSYEERLQSVQDYFKVLYARERMGLGRIRKE